MGNIASTLQSYYGVQSGLTDQDGKEYDYVICGGGTAGCVIASRLSEDSNISVLLIEAGDSDAKQIFSRIPAGWTKLFKTAADWDFETVPQANLGGRRMYLPRGKMLGGCSAINAQIYQHCAPADYDDWAKKGATGWDWQGMKPFFRKAENHTPNPDYDIDLTERGTGGLWNTGYPPTNVVSQALLASAIAAGLPATPDLNIDRHAQGVSRFQATVDSGGTRSSTSSAYLTAPVLARPNLTILTSTCATRLILKGGKVTQVEIGQSKDGERARVKARREVVVCQGAFGTPQLLQVSGIGAKSDLDAIGVEVQVELDGVGHGLRDHIMAGPVYKCKSGTSAQYLMSSVKSLPSLARWLYNGTGPLSSNGAEIGAFMRSDNIPGCQSSIATSEVNASGRDAPDLEIINTPVHYMHHSLASLGNTAEPNGDYFSLFGVVIRPKSTGSVTCQSSDIFDKPLIDPGYLSDPEGYDRKVLLEGVKLVTRLAKTPPLSDFLLESDVPENIESMDDDQLMQFVEKYAETIYHPMSSCRIGAREDGGVVDASLKVHGVTGLRICDASIFPNSLSGHPQAGVVACAEKCADILLHDGI